MGVLYFGGRVEAQDGPYGREYPVVRYANRTPGDPVFQLQRKISDGQAHLSFEQGRGYLPSLLAALGVPVSSQMLVFSATSLQEGLISAARPRAVYYGDDVYVAWVQGSNVLEIGAMDPELGPVFYTLNQQESDAPVFERQLRPCLKCHDTYGLTGGGVPRFLIGSGPTFASGGLASHEGWELTTDETPLNQRWGGWFVTGTHGNQHHAGNIIVPSPNDPAPQTQTQTQTGNLTDLSGLVDTDPYLTGTSDIVALLVVEHQIHVQNVLTRLNWEARKLLAGEAEPAQIAKLVEPVVEAMFFVNEAKLTAPISGTSGFRADFEARGPFDGHGRSLRQFDLTRRIFKYPLSFLIYSEAFDRLPAEVKEQVFQRVWEVLRGDDQSKQFDHLSAADRTAILEILVDTKKDFAHWVAGR